MEQNRIERVSIALKPNVYNTFRNLVNTVSNTLGEYVDNAVQSFLDSKDQTEGARGAVAASVGSVCLDGTEGTAWQSCKLA